MTNEVASDSSASYSRDPAGAITGVDTASGQRMLALNDQHGDLSGVFTAAGAALAGSTSYDPWGSVLATAGPSIQVGYQGQWTDPATQQVDMGARFYGRPPPDSTTRTPTPAPRAGPRSPMTCTPTPTTTP